MSAARTEGGGRWLGVYVLVYLVFLYLPVLLIPLFSFNDSIQAAFPLQGFTLQWYATLLGNPTLSGALANSLVIGVIAASGATLCGITVSYMDLYGRSPLAATISTISRLPILIPGVIVGISLLILVNLVGFGPSRIAIVLATYWWGYRRRWWSCAAASPSSPRPSARRPSISAPPIGRRSGG